MAIKHFGIDLVPQFFNADGTVALNGRFDFFESGTITPKDVFTTRQVDVSAGNSITVNAAGRIDVWMNGVYRIRFFNSQGLQEWELDDVNEDPTPGVSPLPGGTLNLQDNGSFEVDANADGIADGWIRSTFAGGTVLLDTTQSSHGAQSVQMTSIGTGGGTYLSENFLAVNFLRSVELQFSIKSSVVDVRNIVRILWFQADQSPSAITVSTTVYDEAAANPLTFTLQQSSTMPPADARFMKLEFVGCDSTDVTPGNTNYDDVNVFQEIPGSVGPSAGSFPIGYIQDPTYTRDTADSFTFGPYQVSPLLTQNPVTAVAVATTRQFSNLFQRAQQPSGISEDAGSWAAPAEFGPVTNISFTTGPDNIASAAGTPFSAVLAGDKVIVDGSGLNDGTYDVTAVNGGGTDIDVGQTISAEIAGASVTIYLIPQDESIHFFVATMGTTVDIAIDDNVAGTNIGTGQSAGFTAQRRIWSTRLDASADLPDGVKAGNFWYYDTPSLDGTQPTVGTLIPVRVPLELNLQVQIRFWSINGLNNSPELIITPGDTTLEVAGVANADAAARNQFTGTITDTAGNSVAECDTSGRVGMDTALAAAGNRQFRTMGYQDERKQ